MDLGGGRFDVKDIVGGVTGAVFPASMRRAWSPTTTRGPSFVPGSLFALQARSDRLANDAIPDGVRIDFSDMPICLD
jgi:hypothetical protein